MAQYRVDEKGKRELVRTTQPAGASPPAPPPKGGKKPAPPPADPAAEAPKE